MASKSDPKPERKKVPIPELKSSDVDMLDLREDVVDFRGNTPEEKHISALKFKKALLQGKRHFGKSGASLTHLSAPSMRDKLPEGWKREVVDIAMEAETRTTKTLLEWIQDKPSAILIDSCHIPSADDVVDPETGLVEGGDTDHILVIGNMVFVIDTKAWKSTAMYSLDENSHVLRSGKNFAGGHVHIGQSLHLWLDYLKDIFTDDELDTFSIMGFIYIDNNCNYSAEKAKEKDYIRGGGWSTFVVRNQYWFKTGYQKYWWLLSECDFLDWLDKQYNILAGIDDEKSENPHFNSLENIDFINPTLIAKIASTCVKPFDPVTAFASAEALRGLDMH